MKKNSVAQYFQEKGASRPVDPNNPCDRFAHERIDIQVDGAFDLLIALLKDENVALFCDSNMFSAANAKLVPSIIRHPGLVIVPEVEEELKTYLANPPRGPADADVMRLLSARMPLPVFDPDTLGDILPALQHYTKILFARTALLDVVYRDYEKEHGVYPTGAAKTKLVRQLGPLSKRTAALARKGAEQTRPPTATDEALVVEAYAFAALTGRHVAILSTDNDVVEQFYKFTSLLKDDYAASLFALHYADNRERLEPAVSLAGSKFASLDEHFANRDHSFAVACRENLDALFPPSQDEPRVTVLRPDQRCLQVFRLACLPGVVDFLRIKARNGGRNTDAFGDLNVYLKVPLPIPASPIAAFFVRDRLTTSGVTYFDIARAINDWESPLNLTPQTQVTLDPVGACPCGRGVPFRDCHGAQSPEQ